jgi:hypothetical protein
MGQSTLFDKKVKDDFLRISEYVILKIFNDEKKV